MSQQHSPLSVLVVEDEPLFAAQLEALLEDLGYRVLGPAANATAALAAVRQAPAPPDLALLDIDLGPSSLNGIELAQALVAEQALPLIFLTSQADNQSFEQARQVGPAAYLVKPVDPASLQRAIELAVANFSVPTTPPEEEQAPEPPLFTMANTGALLPKALFVKEDGLLVKVNLQDICWVTTEGKYCRLALSGGRTVQVRQPLREISLHLPTDRFVQIQRSYLINAECIERIDPVRNIVQVAGQLLPIGQAHRDKLLERLHLV